jgi:hypothetical protein
MVNSRKASGTLSMTTPDDWQAACDGVVQDLLASAEIASPPVDVLTIAARLEWPVVWDAGQSGRARIQQVDGRPTLLVRPDDRAERLQWSVAHEIGEASAWRICQRAGIAADELTPRQREELANQLARRLLIPTAWYCAAIDAAGDDLYALKEHFATASHELIAWRWLDLAEPVIVTVFDHGVLSRRRCNFAARAPALCDDEAACVADVRRTGVAAHRTWSNGTVAAWPVYEPGWRREILRTRIDADSFAAP